MFKQLLFLHKSDNDKALPHFKEVIVPLLTEVTGKEISLAKVESNLLLDQKYSFYCEAVFESQSKMNEQMNTRAGKQLTKALMDFHKMITMISVNYQDKE